MVSVREIAEQCLGKTGSLSLKVDIFGVIGNDNPQLRSLQERLELISTKPFVRVAVVTVVQNPGAGAYGNLQRDLDAANTVFQTRCGGWVYGAASSVEVTSLLGTNGILDQDDCKGDGFLGIGGHSVSDEEDDLFDLGRDLGAAIVCYYIAGSTDGSLGGCAAHPDGRPGFWVAVGSSRWMFAHELGHILGLGHRDDRDNLMWPKPGAITSNPPELSTLQCLWTRDFPIIDLPLVERCE
jgi:hypothetical protein